MGDWYKSWDGDEPVVEVMLNPDGSGIVFFGDADAVADNKEYQELLRRVQAWTHLAGEA